MNLHIYLNNKISGIRMNIKEFSVKPIIASSIPLKNSDAWDDGSNDNNDDTKDESNDEAKINIHQDC